MDRRWLDEAARRLDATRDLYPYTKDAQARGPQIATLQSPNPAAATVSRQPQTTGGTGGPFIRLSRKAKIQGFASSGNAFGSAPITQSLKPVGGYLRGLILFVQATGGTSTTTVTISMAQDAPWNAISNIRFNDPSGQPILTLDGFGLYLLNCYSGMNPGELSFQSPVNAPSFATVTTTSSTGAGNFSFKLWLPLELDSAGYCCLPGLNASAQPTLVITPNTSGSVYTAATNVTMPTLTFTVTQSFWTLPVAAPNITPPGLGSSSQWNQTQGQQTFGSGAFARSAVPATGAWWHTAIFVLRDSSASSVRVNNWPTTDLTFYVDGVPLELERYDERIDFIFQNFGIPLNAQSGSFPSFTQAAANATATNNWQTIPQPQTVGVNVYTFRDSVRHAVGQDDTHDLLLPTTPATLAEIAGTAGTGGTAPYQLTNYVGQLYPDNPTNIPYTHLAV